MMRACRNPLMVALLVSVCWLSMTTVNPARAAERLAGFPEELTFRNLNVYWTATPPVLDGIMDDACWQDAEVAGNFVLHASNPPRPATQQTEVRAAYDAEYLYLFFSVADDQMHNVVLGQPEDHRNVNVHGGGNNDSIEIFLNPRQAGRRFQLMANARGARWESPGWRLEWRWTPDWKIVVDHNQPDRWTAEIAIPFSELRYADGGASGVDLPYASTPVEGEVWGASFCRNQARLFEWSQWSLSLGGFGNIRHFGTLTFKGRRQGPTFPDVQVEAQPLVNRFGATTARLAVDPADDVEARFWLFNEGRQVDGGILDRAQGHVELAYRINDGGAWRLQLDMTRNGELFYRGTTGADLSRIGPVVETILNTTARIRLLAQPAAEPRFQAMLADVSGLEAAASALSVRLAGSADWSDDDWREAAELADELSGETESLTFHRYRLELFNAQAARPGFAAVIADADTKIYPQDGPPLNTGAPVAVLEAAGNMTESFQVALVPFWEAREAVAVQFSDLTGPHGAVSAEHLSYRIVDYVKMRENALAMLDGIREYEPDVLRSAYPFGLAADRIVTLWVDVHCPAGTVAGDYTGRMQIHAGGDVVDVEIRLHAYGFDIPARSTLKNNHWFNIGKSFGLLAYYPEIPRDAYTLDVYREHLKFGRQYRMTLFPDDFDFKVRADMLPIRRLENGDLEYDFSIWEQWYELGFAHGGNLIRASGGCNTAVFSRFMSPSSLRVVCDTDGQTYTFQQLYPDWYEQDRRNREAGVGRSVDRVFEHPGLRQYLRQWTDFLDRKGWLAENVQYEIQDEQPPLNVIRWHRPLRTLIPEMPLLSYGARPSLVIHNLRFHGYIDIWAPGLYAFDRADFVEAMRARREQYGERTSFYVCSGWGWHAPYSSTRVLPWAAFRHDAHHFLKFMAAHFSIPRDELESDPTKRYPAVPFPGSAQQYNLVWPGPDLELYPSIRLSSMRDGMEDYELLYMLRDRCRYMTPEVPLHAELLDAANALLDLDTLFADVRYTGAVPPGSGGRAWQYIGAQVDMVAHRRKVARLIQRINAAIAAYPAVLSEQD